MSQVSDKYELDLDLRKRRCTSYQKRTNFQNQYITYDKKKMHISKNLLLFVFFRVYNNRNGMFKNLHREIENNIPTKTKRHI